MVPAWLHALSILSLLAGFACFAIIVQDEVRDPQHMWIMNIVWPVVALVRLRHLLPRELVAYSLGDQGENVRR